MTMLEPEISRMDAAQDMSGKLINGATVYDNTGEKLGTIAEVNLPASYVLVEKGWLFRKDFYIPISAVTNTDEHGGLYLNLTKTEVEQGYDMPPDGSIPDEDSAGAGMPVPGAVAHTDVIAEKSGSSMPAGDLQAAAAGLSAKASGDASASVPEDELVARQRQAQESR